jgi:site-specific recombinase XerD
MTTLLRKQLNDHMTLRGLSPNTQAAYTNAVAGLAGYYHLSPDKLTNEQIQAYLIYLIKERELAWSSCNVVFSGLRCFYSQVLRWDETRFHIPSRPREKKLPRILSLEQVHRLFKVTTNIKHRALLMTVYGGGLRVSEVVQLEPEHIESQRMMIRIDQGKGRKDRFTLLPQNLLDELKAYWKACRPHSRLFFGKSKDKPMAIGTAQRIYYNAKSKAGINKGNGIHTLRHCFATHLLDQGVDITTIQQMMGHRALVTTSKYLHTTKEKIASIKSPLDTLDIHDKS